jgi:MFS family permease
MKTDKVLNKRLHSLFAGAFFQSFVFWYAIEKPFLAHLGLDKEAIALIATVFSASYLLVNIPSGILADRWSRRNVLVLASLCLAIACALASSSHGFLTYAVASFIFGAFIASTQGTYDSIIYDTVLEETGSDGRYTHYYGRLRFAQGAGFAVSSLLGGVIGHYISLRAAYYLSIPGAGIAIVALLAFREPKLHKKLALEALHVHLKQTVRTILRRGPIVNVVISLVLVAICALIMNELDQIWMLAFALPILLYGPVNASLLASTAVSGILANHAARSRRGTAIVVGTVLLAAILLLFHKLLLVVLGQILFLGSVTILQIVLSRDLHAVAASHVRSGASSLVTTIGTVLFIPIAILFGYISDRYSVFHAAWVVLAVVVLLCVSTLYTVYSQPSSALMEAES